MELLFYSFLFVSRPTMSLIPRQTRILEELEQRGALTLESLAAQFGVTVQTLRRDVTLLAGEGRVARYHGGVRLPIPTTENAAYHQRQRTHAEAKKAIARLVATTVPEGCSLLLNIGTTAEAGAREMLGHRHLGVITNNLNVASILAANPHCEVIVAADVATAGGNNEWVSDRDPAPHRLRASPRAALSSFASRPRLRFLPAFNPPPCPALSSKTPSMPRLRWSRFCSKPGSAPDATRRRSRSSRSTTGPA
jgi:DNA-binding Lrp family transcriptional regulator